MYSAACSAVHVSIDRCWRGYWFEESQDRLDDDLNRRYRYTVRHRTVDIPLPFYCIDSQGLLPRTELNSAPEPVCHKHERFAGRGIGDAG